MRNQLRAKIRLALIACANCLNKLKPKYLRALPQNSNNRAWAKDTPGKVRKSFQLAVVVVDVCNPQASEESGSHKLLLKCWGSSRGGHAQFLQNNLLRLFIGFDTGKKSATMYTPAVIARNHTPKEGKCSILSHSYPSLGRRARSPF